MFPLPLTTLLSTATHRRLLRHSQRSPLCRRSTIMGYGITIFEIWSKPAFTIETKHFVTPP